MTVARHILAYAQSLDRGGVERALVRLAGSWAERGRRVTLVVGEAHRPIIGVAQVDLGTSRYRGLVAAVPSAVREAAPDVIFCPGNHYSAVAAWTRLRLGRGCPPTVAKLSNALDRSDMTPVGRITYRHWLRTHPRFVDRLVAMSPAMAIQAAQTMAIPRERIAVIPNPPPPPTAGGPPTGLPPRYLLGVGRLVSQKRWDRAIVALGAIADRTLPLVILGDGAERAALTALADRLGLGDRLLLPGAVADPLPAMAGARALVLTSDYEGVPGVLREALSVGTPVIATDSSPAIREIVACPALGTVVAREDAVALVAAIDAWLAPGRARPAPVSALGDPAGDYLALFDSLMSS